jgi:hypothetical protein
MCACRSLSTASTAGGRGWEFERCAVLENEAGYANPQLDAAPRAGALTRASTRSSSRRATRRVSSRPVRALQRMRALQRFVETLSLWFGALPLPRGSLQRRAALQGRLKGLLLRVACVACLISILRRVLGGANALGIESRVTCTGISIPCDEEVPCMFGMCFIICFQKFQFKPEVFQVVAPPLKWGGAPTVDEMGR